MVSAWRVISFPVRILLMVSLYVFWVLWWATVAASGLTKNITLNTVIAMPLYIVLLVVLVPCGVIYFIRACMGWVDVRLGIQTPLQAARDSLTWPNLFVRPLTRWAYGVEIVMKRSDPGRLVLRDVKTGEEELVDQL